MIRPVLLAAVLALVPWSAPATAQNANNPIPGVDVVVKKRPSGSAVVVATTGRDGRFSARVRVEPGEYEITGACRTRRACPPFRLISVRVDGRALGPDAQGRLIFTVRPGATSALVDGSSALQEVSLTR